MVVGRAGGQGGIDNPVAVGFRTGTVRLLHRASTEKAIDIRTPFFNLFALKWSRDGEVHRFVDCRRRQNRNANAFSRFSP